MGTKHHVAGAKPGWTPDRTLVLPLTAEQWPPPGEPALVDDVWFVPKRELHVTLIGRGLGQSLYPDPVRRQAVREAVTRLDWGFTRTGEQLQLKKRELAGSGHGRRSVRSSRGS